MILFFDTETTGLPDFKKQAEDPYQPHIVQLAMLLHDDSRKAVAEINVLVRPDGWSISKEASDIHGITQDRALRYGLKLATVVGLFMAFMERSKLLVAHNDSFDGKMMRRELHHLGRSTDAESIRSMPSYCTMKNSTDIVKIPGKYGFKWPNLQEAHTHFLGKPFDGAHDAMADVRACAAVYYAMNPLPSAPTPTMEVG